MKRGLQLLPEKEPIETSFFYISSTVTKVCGWWEMEEVSAPPLKKLCMYVWSNSISKWRETQMLIRAMKA